MNRGRPNLAGGGPPRWRALEAGTATAEARGEALPLRTRAASALLAERRLVRRVFRRCQSAIEEACVYSSVPREFLGALVANESAGDPQAARFEPAVYRHLKSLAEGARSTYAGLSRQDLEDEIVDMLHPKADSFHALFLTSSFHAANEPELSRTTDEALRELATSWGFTQIMGYHLVGRPGTVRDLLEPRFNFRLALELLAQFAERYQLDLRQEFEEMFRCWNTGQPYGETFDPAYVEKGLRRMVMYRELGIGNG